MANIGSNDTTRELYDRERKEHWDKISIKMDRWKSWGVMYRKRLSELFRLSIPPGKKVLELGCGRGDLLAQLEPSLGVGIDFSPEMIRRANERHPNLVFLEADAHNFKFEEYFVNLSKNHIKEVRPLTGIHAIEPIGYLDFLQLMSHSDLVLTDSGGIQEETTILGVPCVTLRENTERPVTVTNGTNVIVGIEKKDIVKINITAINGIECRRNSLDINPRTSIVCYRNIY